MGVDRARSTTRIRSRITSRPSKDSAKSHSRPARVVPESLPDRHRRFPNHYPTVLDQPRRFPNHYPISTGSSRFTTRVTTPKLPTAPGCARLTTPSSHSPPRVPKSPPRVLQLPPAGYDGSAGNPRCRSPTLSYREVPALRRRRSGRPPGRNAGQHDEADHAVRPPIMHAGRRARSEVPDCADRAAASVERYAWGRLRPP